MAKQQMDIILTFDAKTGALKQVQGDLDKVKGSLDKIQGGAKKTGGEFSQIGNIVKGLGLATILMGAARSAFASSQALAELRASFEIFVSDIVGKVEPALRLMSNGWQGLFALMQGKDISEAAEIAAGKTKVVLDSVVKAHEYSARQIYTNTEKSATERLRLLEGAEAKHIELLKQTARFAGAMELDKNAMLEEAHYKYAALRMSIQNQESSLNKQAAMEEIDDLRQNAAIKMEMEQMEWDERVNAIGERLATELQMVQDKEDAHTLVSKDAEAMRTKLIKDSGREIAQIRLSQHKDAVANEANKVNAVLAVEQALGNNLISLSKRLAAGEKITGREMAKEAVQTAADAASAQIMALYAVGAAKEASRGLPGLIPAAIMLAKGAALAASVAALGGVAARAIGGGGGGGEGAETQAPELGFEPSAASTGGGSSVQASAATAEPGTTSRVTIINLPMLDGRMSPQAARNVKEALDESDANLGEET